MQDVVGFSKLLLELSDEALDLIAECLGSKDLEALLCLIDSLGYVTESYEMA